MLRWGTLLLLLTLLGGCIHVFRRVDAREVDLERPPVAVGSPVKVHLLDGSVALFPDGVSFQTDSLYGFGQHYGLDLRADTASGAVRLVLPLDSVAALESYREGVRPIESLVATSAATVAGTFGTALALVAIFGSCPTVYSASGDSLILEAESFSNSIVPLFEVRDVDRLHARPDAEGRLMLEVRNEALETHYINHLELVEVEHEPGSMAVPGERGEALVLSGAAAPVSATDRRGHSVLPVLRHADGTAYETSAATLEAAGPDDLMDEIDLVFPAPKQREAGLYVRLRNSLLGTVYLYDFMLAAQGAQALDWMAKELNSIRGAVRLGTFYRQRMGLRVHVWDGAAYREVGRVREVGPIAWDDVAVRVPVLTEDSVRIRLRFIADAWRIDRVALAGAVETVSGKAIPLHSVTGVDSEEAPNVYARLSNPDESYHVTSPGERFWIQFDTPPAPVGKARTYFLAAQGYYTEWIRGAWVRTNDQPQPFQATDETLAAAIRQWIRVKEEFERRFEETKIPVR